MEANTNNYNMRFLIPYFEHKPELWDYFDAESNGMLIKSIWIATNECKKKRTVENVTFEKPKDNGKQCVEFLFTLTVIHPEHEEEKKALFDLQDTVSNFLLRKLFKEVIGEEVEELLTSTVALYEKVKAERDNPNSTSEYTSQNVDPTNDLKRKLFDATEKEQIPENGPEKKKPKVEDEKDILQNAKKALLEFADNRTMDWTTRNANEMDRELILMILGITTKGYQEQEDEIEENDKKVRSLIRRLEREFHPDRNKAVSELEKKLFREIHDFLVDIKSRFKES